MKKAVLALLFSALLFSCEQTPSYTINGKVLNSDAEGKQVLLGKIQNEETIFVDSTFIRKGKYRFTGSVDQADLYVVNVVMDDPKTRPSVGFVLENASIIITTDTLGSRIGGTAMNDSIQNYQDRDRLLTEAMMVARNEQNVGEYRKLYDAQRIGRFDFIKNNVNNPGVWSMLGHVVYNPLSDLKAIVAGADARTSAHPVMERIVERIHAMETAVQGNPFIDLEMPNPEGKMVKLSDYVGKTKYVLVDFWASWCSPCIADLPHVFKVYEKYKKRGLEIVGVSFDNSQEAWLKGIKEHKLPWPQMSDVKGWDSMGARLYAIPGIPYTALIDQSGTMIALNLRGESLDKKLAELMGK